MVSDVDASAGKAKQLGAKLMVPPQDIEKLGRFSVVADPQGAVFAISRGRALNPTIAQLEFGMKNWNSCHACRCWRRCSRDHEFSFKFLILNSRFGTTHPAAGSRAVAREPFEYSGCTQKAPFVI